MSGGTAGSFQWAPVTGLTQSDTTYRTTIRSSGTAVTSGTALYSLNAYHSVVVALRVSVEQTITPPSGFVQIAHPHPNTYIFFNKYLAADSNLPFSWATSCDYQMYVTLFLPMGLEPGAISADNIDFSYGPANPGITTGGNNATVFHIDAHEGSSYSGSSVGFSDEARYTWNATPTYGYQIQSKFQPTAGTTGSELNWDVVLAVWPTGQLPNTVSIKPNSEIEFYDTSGTYVGESRYYKWDGSAWVGGAYSEGANYLLLNDQIHGSDTWGPAQTDDAGYGLTSGANTFNINKFGLENMPTNFQSMNTLSIRYSTAQDLANPYVDDTAQISCIVRTPSGNVLAQASSSQAKTLDLFTQNSWSNTAHGSAPTMAADGSGSPPKQNKVLYFENVFTTATKAMWDQAELWITHYDETNMGNDGARLILLEVELIGTYTTSGPPPTTITPTGSKSATTAGTGQLTVTGISDYVVEYRETIGPGPWVRFTDTVTALTEVAVTGLTDDTSYDFRVAAVNEAGIGLWSNIATVFVASGTYSFSLGDLLVSDMKLGDTHVVKAYLGDMLVMDNPP